MSDNLQYKPYYERYLPHFQPIDSYFFITYRLAFSLPKKILEDILNKRKEFDCLIEKLPENGKKMEKYKYNKILFKIEDDYLSNCTDGPHWLKDERIAKVAFDSLLFNHEKTYKLICAVIMSNHIHIVIKPLINKNEKPFSISEIMKNHKNFVAHKSNEILKRKGAFWTHESYDHYIRDEKEFKNIINYILNNPVKAGLVNSYKKWKHYWLNENYITFCN